MERLSKVDLITNAMRHRFVVIANEEKQCEAHGPYMADGYGSREAPDVPSRWSRCPTCIKEAEEAVEAAKREQEEAARRERYQWALRRSELPRRFIGRGFTDFLTATDQQRRALSVCRDFAESFQDAKRTGASLVLSGLPGTGKSHLAAAIVQAVMEGGADARYITMMDMVRAVRGTWRKGSEQSEDQVIDELGFHYDLLVVDEIGMQYGTDGEQTILFDILDRRYRDMRPTVLLTNQDRNGFKAYVGDRIHDRLTETAKWVPFDWESYRPKARAV
jgi:DNA replication protein DnaC